MFGNLSDRLTQSFRSLRSRGVLTESDVDHAISDIRRALIDADVALPVVRQFTTQVREKAYGAARSKALNPGQQVVSIVHEELVEILGGATRELTFAESGPTVFMLAGLQGAGKTTLAGKLGKWLREEGKTVLLVASDLQRPNAVQQLQVVGERAGVKVWAPEPGNGVGDPVEVARSGVEWHQRGHRRYGRSPRCRPGDDGPGDRYPRRRAPPRDHVRPRRHGRPGCGLHLHGLPRRCWFHGCRPVEAGWRRARRCRAVRVTGAPILFASTGEGLDDFERFHADRMAGRILDMGDILTLIEQAEKKMDAEEAEKVAAKAMAGQLTLADFLSQLQQIKKLGSMKKMLGMIPGAAQMREQIENFDEREVDRVEAIVRSMTPAEREDVSILNGSRRARIARGSGTTVTEVNQLVQRFEAAREMMAQMGQMGGGVPGMGALPGRGGKAKQKANARKAQAQRARMKKSARSGNPAKRRQQELEAMLPPSERSAPKGSSFGVAQEAPAARPTIDDLPDDVKRMLGQL